MEKKNVFQEKETDTQAKTVNPLLEFVSWHDETIHKARHMAVGLTSWYKAYMASDNFKDLPSRSQVESFEIYEGLKDMLEYLDNTANDNQEEIDEIKSL